MDIGMLKPMFKPMMNMLRKLSVDNNIKAMVFKFDEKGELQHELYNEEVVVMKRSEFNEMINNLTTKNQ